MNALPSRGRRRPSRQSMRPARRRSPRPARRSSAAGLEVVPQPGVVRVRRRQRPRHTEAGVLAIDTNASERALRAVAVGRKNSLFAGSDAGGRSAAVLYSVVGTCRRLGLDPFAYLRDPLARLPGLPAGRTDELLPGRRGPAR